MIARDEMTDVCLSLDEMHDFLSGKHNSGEMGRIEEHLAECELCCGALEALDEGPSIPIEELKQFEADFKEEATTLGGAVESGQEPASVTRLWKYAAAVLLLVLPAYLLIQNYSTSAEKLFAAYYVPYGDIVNVRSADPGISKEFSAGMRHYKNAEYAEAIAIFEDILKDHPDEELVYLYCGISHLSTNETDKAVGHFKQITKNTSSIFYSQARWYLALTYLKMEDMERTKELLEIIRSGKSVYQRKAAGLLHSL